MELGKHPWTVVAVIVGLCGCGSGTRAGDAGSEAADVQATDPKPQDVWEAMTPTPDVVPENGGCPHMDCSYYAFHYAAFQLNHEDCEKKLTGATGCVACCAMGYGGKKVESQWCCPPDEDAILPDASETSEGE